MTGQQSYSLATYLWRSLDGRACNCDNSFRGSLQWAANHGYDPSAIITDLTSSGYGCDCEVVYGWIATGYQGDGPAPGIRLSQWLAPA